MNRRERRAEASRRRREGRRPEATGTTVPHQGRAVPVQSPAEFNQRVIDDLKHHTFRGRTITATFFDEITDPPMPPPDETVPFRRAIQDRPDDDGPRQVFADWLDERGDPRGQFIRLQLEAKTTLYPGNNIRVQEAALLKEFGLAWMLEDMVVLMGHRLSITGWRRGFVEGFSVWHSGYPDIAAAIKARRRTPLRTLTLPGDAWAENSGMTRWLYFALNSSLDLVAVNGPPNEPARIINADVARGVLRSARLHEAEKLLPRRFECNHVFDDLAAETVRSFLPGVLVFLPNSLPPAEVVRQLPAPQAGQHRQNEARQFDPELINGFDATRTMQMICPACVPPITAHSFDRMESAPSVERFTTTALRPLRTSYQNAQDLKIVFRQYLAGRCPNPVCGLVLHFPPVEVRVAERELLSYDDPRVVLAERLRRHAP